MTVCSHIAGRAPNQDENMNLQEAIDTRRFEVIISDYGFQGEGFVRLDDGWLSVPSALPGECVVIEVLERELPARRRLFGRVVEVLEASPLRVSAECDEVNRCRGCHLRHTHPDEEQRFKVQSVVEILEKYAGLAGEEQPGIHYIGPLDLDRSQGYRNRAYLALGGASGSELGMKSRAAESLISMSSCPALVGPLRQLVAQVEAVVHDNAGFWLGSGPSPIRGLQLALSNLGSTRVVIDLVDA
jgi:23S rRNA (uracil1939-C5)-methyltransferase